ncbi:uncharacterized protein LOC143919273 [Arctopsyche grandis]|uniref:uncharacterized protein LOC143919273 n=1 Tax=Arctopsyche grandis TaxID=121162 RepID=UPI00406D66AF
MTGCTKQPTSILEKKKKLPCPCATCPKKKKTIRYCQPPVPESFAPKRSYKKPSDAFVDSTIYNLSYKCIPGVDVRCKPIVQYGNLILSSAKMTTDTVHKLSYLPNPAKMLKPFIPRNNDLSGKGPMQDLTTHKHDYVPKPFTLTSAIKPNINLGLSTKAIDGTTVYKGSYQAPGGVPLTRSYAPRSFYKAPSQKMETSTVHKITYCPNLAVPKKALPWVPKSEYRKSTAAFDDNTIYKNSFLPPGWECEDYSNEPNCCNTDDFDCTCRNDENGTSETFPKAAC